jgi:hypothetical protein
MFLDLTDPHPDPLVRDTDQRIRIRNKMSRIPNTVFWSLPVTIYVFFQVAYFFAGTKRWNIFKKFYQVLLLIIQYMDVIDYEEGK